MTKKKSPDQLRSARWFAPDDLRAFGHRSRAMQMGYAPDGRQRFVNDAHLPLAYTTIETTPAATAGDGLPLVLRGGRAIAVWTHRFVRKAIEVSVKPFPGERVKRDEVRTGFEEIAAFMSCEDLAFEIGSE